MCSVGQVSSLWFIYLVPLHLWLRAYIAGGSLQAMCCYSRRRMSSASVLLLLVGLCAATEYYVKPTIPQETSCPRESCYTLDELAAKYFYASATDVLTDNVTVIFLNGTHELESSIFVSEVNDFTLHGAGGISGDSHVEIKCKGESSLRFDSIINLTITRITLSNCAHTSFSGVFNLRLIWVEIQKSTGSGIAAINVFGSSVIGHSVFNGTYYPLTRCIFIWYNSCTEVSHKCTNKTKSLLHAVNSHKLQIHNCVIEYGTTGSMKVNLDHTRYKVELDLLNITALNGGNGLSRGDIHIRIQNEVNYVVTLRDSYIGNSEGAAISILLLRPEANLSQRIHISNSVIDKGKAGIDIRYYNSPASKTIPQIMIDNCIIMNIRFNDNKYRRESYKAIRVYAEHPQLSVVLSNISFDNNKLGGIHIFSVKEVELADCRFVGNEGTPIALYSSTIKVSGTLTFMNNTAYQGGAMAFYGKSYMSVNSENETQIVFINNYAEQFGGAIFVQQTEDVPCFLQLATHYSKTKCPDLKTVHRFSFVFTNNTAHNGGDAIYGGSLYHCTAGYCKRKIRKTIVSVPILGATIFVINYWNLVQYDTGHHSNISLISSAPSRVCLCEDGQPDCLTVFKNQAHYPGETFSISAVVVGQGFGTVDGMVCAQFTNKDTPRLEELQQTQQVTHSSCTELKYTVFSANKNELMVLSVRQTASELGGFHYNPSKVAYISKDYKRMLTINIETVSQVNFLIEKINGLLAMEVFVNISLLPCPPGFMLSDQPSKCVCHTTLQLHNITCNIDDQTVHRGGTVWVNASFAGNESNGVIVHHHCPYAYCNTAELDIRLDSPDTQCNFNHSGILCGGCRPGLSLTLGTSQCLRCSNKYIALLIPFAIAGIVLVAFIKLLNLTVSEGTLNGLIFYANIIGANQATFFPSTSTHCPVLTVFIAWLNLDLGIETCFIDGLNGYWKTWLQFVFPAYIWIITAVIIVVAHYSSTGARVFGSNSVQVLATLFLLSYTKLLRTIITVISFTFLDYPNDFRTTVWLCDGNIPYLSPTHTPLFLVALTVFILLWLPYTVVLLLVQYLRKKAHHRLLCWFAKLKPLFDAYLGPFKDKHCYWVGVLLLVRAVLFIISAVNPNNAPKVNLLAIGSTTLVLLAYTATAGKVYRKKYVSFLENSFLLNLGALTIGGLYTGVNGQGHTAVVHTLVGIAFLQFLGIIIFHGYCSIKETRIWQHVTARCTLVRCTDQEEDRDLNYQPFEAAQAMPVRLRMIFNELNEPVIQNADDSM